MDGSRADNKVRQWIEAQGAPFRDAIAYLLFTAIFSILPTISGYLLLNAFGKWNGEWAKLLQSGDLLVASTSLMASALYSFNKAERGFLKTLSSLFAVIVIVFATLFYCGLALSEHGIIPPNIKMIPSAVVGISFLIYFFALVVGFHALYSDQIKATPSNLEVRNEQVDKLESELNNLGGVR